MICHTTTRRCQRYPQKWSKYLRSYHARNVNIGSTSGKTDTKVVSCGKFSKIGTSTVEFRGSSYLVNYYTNWKYNLHSQNYNTPHAGALELWSSSKTHQWRFERTSETSNKAARISVINNHLTHDILLCNYEYII